MTKSRAWFSRYNIKTKLLIYRIGILVLVSIGVAVNGMGHAHFFNAYTVLRQQYAGLNAFYNAIDEATSEITAYYRSRDTEHYTRYTQHLQNAQAQLYKLYDLTGNESLRWEYHKLYRMTLTYRKNVEETLETSSGGPISLNDYAQINRLNELINMTSNRLFYTLTQAANQESSSVFASGQTISMMLNAVIGIIVLFCLAFSVYMIRSVTEPLNKLNQLLESENDHLRIKELLTKTELKALQSQVNPHFLFNTLSIISKTAYIENASQTVDMLESTTALLRYSLDNMCNPSNLEKEIDSIHNYLYIQSTRLGQRITLRFDVEPDLPNVPMPALILQPIVENAIIHGVFHMETGGEVKISAKRRKDFICIEIADNGVGMPAETIAKFLADNDDTDIRGIGILNVKKRLAFFFERKQLLEINSSPGSGTTVTIFIPDSFKAEG